MKGDQLKETVKENQEKILSKTPTDGSLKSFKANQLQTKFISEDDDYSYSVLSKTNTKLIKRRKLKVNIQGQKVDSDYLGKNLTPFSTTYKSMHNFHQREKMSDLVLPVVPENEQPKQEQSAFNSAPISPNKPIFSGQLIQFIDSIPLSDPIWKLVIPESFLKDPNINVEKLVEENQNYFYNLLGLLFQERTMREIPLTKLTVPLKFVKNDIPLHIETNKPITCKTLIKFINLLAKAYETQFPNGKNLNFQSTYQSVYQTLPFTQTENYKPEFIKYYNQLQQLTQYKSDFPDWQSPRNIRIEKAYLMSTGSLPFIGVSSYQENFQNLNKISNDRMPKKKIGPFASGTNLLFKNSKHSEQFKIPKLEKSQQTINFPGQPILPSGSFMGQYKSTFQRDYNKLGIFNPESFQQNKVWKMKMVSKINELRSEQQSEVKSDLQQ